MAWVRVKLYIRKSSLGALEPKKLEPKLSEGELPALGKRGRRHRKPPSSIPLEGRNSRRKHYRRLSDPVTGILSRRLSSGGKAKTGEDPWGSHHQKTQVPFFTSTIEALARKLDGVIPSIATKLSSLPSRILYPLCRSTDTSSPPRRSSLIMKLRLGGNESDLTTSSSKESLSSADLDAKIPTLKDPSRTKRVISTRELAFGFYDAPCFISEKKYDQRTILDRRVAGQLRIHLPIIPRSSDFWTVLYGSNNDGFNLSTLHSLCAMRKSQLLVISALPYAQAKHPGPVCVPENAGAPQNAVFGAFVNEGLKIDDDFYGSSSCFLWRRSLNLGAKSSSLSRRSSLSSLSSAPYDPSSLVPNSEYAPAKSTSATNQDIKRGSATPSNITSADDRSSQSALSPCVEVYHATGSDSKYIISDGSFIALGIGRMGKFGLWLSKHLDYGFTSPSATYGNPSLLDGSSEGSHFKVCSIEVWGLG